MIICLVSWGAQPMLGAIITTRSLSVKAANPTLKMNKSGKNAYFHFLPLPALFFHFNLRGGKSVQKSPSFVVFWSKPSLSGEESQINCWGLGEAAIKDENFVRGGVLEKTTHIGGPRS